MSVLPDTAPKHMPPPPGSCPYLWLASDPSLRLTYADSGHRCFAQVNAPEYRPDSEFQQSHCLTDRYVHCPRYQPASSDPPPYPGAFSKAPVKPARSLLRVAVWVALGAIGLVVVWLIAGRALTPQAPTPANLSVAALSPTLPAEAELPAALPPEPTTISRSGAVTATLTPTSETRPLETPAAQEQIVLITAEAVNTATRTPLLSPPTPTTKLTRAAKLTPTQSPSATQTPTRVPPTPTQASPTPQQTATPTLSPTPVKPGLILDFEAFGFWERGNEPYGTFAQSEEKAHEGVGSGKLAYDIPAVDKNYVVFLRKPVTPIPGEPQTLTAWVYGDGSGLFLNAWIQDSQGEVRQFPLGRILHTDSWQPMVSTLDPAAPWPQVHISGPDNGVVDYPVSLYGLVLDAEGSPAKSGQIFIDELTVSDSPVPPVAGGGAVTPASPGATPTSSSPAGAISGRIAYTTGDGTPALMGVDAATGNTWQIAPNARQPDNRGSLVLANGSGGGRDNVFITSGDGGSERIVGMHPEDAYPSWSPSGESAAFSSTIADGKERVYVQWNLTQQEEPTLVKVGDADVFGRNPTWMDNGRIAYTGCNYWAEGSQCGIWAVTADNSAEPYRLSDQADDVSSDSFGGNLLYQSRAAGNWDVYIVPATGGTPRNLTNSPSQDSGATFSPDGRSVAFMSDRDGSWGIWIMGIDGSNPQKVLAVPGGFGADWPNERLSWST